MLLSSRFRHRKGLATLFALMITTAATAHPHVFVTAAAGLFFDTQGRMTGVQHVWQFDPAFSAFATQGLDANHDRKLSQTELAPLAKINIESLKPYHDFTWLTVGHKKISFDPPEKYFLQMRNDLLTLFFKLPLTKPTFPGPNTTLEIYDPEYFVAFTFDKKIPLALFNPPSGCIAEYHPPQLLSTNIMTALAAVPISQHDLPSKLQSAATQLANVFDVSCQK
jgi:ABC-type uncharacterized transport system substrate-binding protein